MRPYLHKYIASSPSASGGSVSSSKKSKQSSPHKLGAQKKPHSLTASCDTVEYESEQKYSEQDASSALTTPSATSVKSRSSKYVDSLILIETKSVSDDAAASKPSQSQYIGSLAESKYFKYWTVTIASTHCRSPKDASLSPLLMGFGVREAAHDESKDEAPATNPEDDELAAARYEFPCCDDQQYQSYHTKLKSLDDILIAFNTKSNKVTMWQNGKRFNKVFQLHPDRVYGFGIKLMSDDEYSINILPDTGN